MRPQSVMVFAAGFGTRMRHLTTDRPKALIRVNGETLLDRTLALASEAGLRHQVVNAHYRADQIVAHLNGRKVRVSVEEPDILDTGGGLKAALPLFAERAVVTCNSDAAWAGPNPFNTLLSQWKPDRMDALLLVVPARQALAHTGPGDFSLYPDGQLSRSGNHVYSGVQILNTDLIARHDEDIFSLNRIWDRIAGTGGLFGCVYPGNWCDVGHPEGLALAEKLLSGGADV